MSLRVALKVALTDDLATCLALREQVFVREQGVSPDRERDGLDEGALHLLARLDGRAVGCARLLVSGDTGKIQRVCVLADARGHGVGEALVRASLDCLGGLPGLVTARLGAQAHALGFYERLGFAAFGPVYDDAGIAHRDMQRPL